MRRGQPFVVLAAVALAGLAAGCASVIGLQDRKDDPALDAVDAGGGSGGADGGDADAAPDGPGEGGGDAAPGTLDCAAYCSTIRDVCTESIEQYTSAEICNLVCNQLPLGTTDNPTGNTIACRNAQAELAASFAIAERSSYCSIAGPAGTLTGGATECGSPCDAYCALMSRVCPTYFGSILGNDLGTCKATCSQLPDLGEYSTAIVSGNSVQCRIYHVNAAAKDPATHCPHAAGLQLCVP